MDEAEKCLDEGLEPTIISLSLTFHNLPPYIQNNFPISIFLMMINASNIGFPEFSIEFLQIFFTLMFSQ